MGNNMSLRGKWRLFWANILWPCDYCGKRHIWIRKQHIIFTPCTCCEPPWLEDTYVCEKGYKESLRLRGGGKIR